MLITYEALVKENSLLAGKLRLDNSEQIKNCLGKNSKTFRGIKHQQTERGRKRGREESRKEGGREGGREGRGKEGEEGEKVEWQEGTKNAQKIMKHTKPQHHYLTIILFIIINTFH